jgi:hypothetical protein
MAAKRRKKHGIRRSILTMTGRKPFVRPLRSEFGNDIDFIRAVHKFNDGVASYANSEFDKSFRESMRKKK